MKPSSIFTTTLCLGASTVLGAFLAHATAEETNAGRAPTGTVTNPGDLLKEPDGVEFRFSYFPSSDRLRLLVLRPPQQFTKWEVSVHFEN